MYFMELLNATRMDRKECHTKKDYSLVVEFCDGSTKKVDMKSFIEKRSIISH